MFSTTYEALMRTQILMFIHNTKLPSYCIWTDEDINKETTDQRMDWWRNMIKEANESNFEVDKYNTGVWPFVSLRQYAIKWIKELKKEKNKNIIQTSLNEYCSKRMGWDLSCDI